MSEGTGLLLVVWLLWLTFRRPRATSRHGDRAPRCLDLTARGMCQATLFCLGVILLLWLASCRAIQFSERGCQSSLKRVKGFWSTWGFA